MRILRRPPAAFCEAAPLVKCHTHLPSSYLNYPRVLEMLLSLLFALSLRLVASAHLGYAMGVGGAN